MKQTSQPPKAIIYCRISSIKQRVEGSGLESQEHRCRKYANSQGYSVEKVFTDDVSGGGDFMKRKGMVALLDYLRRRRNTDYVVIFDDLKRFARDTMFHLKLRAEMTKYHATIECLNFKFEDTPEGKFVEIIHAAQGELERAQTGRQTIQKMQARLEQGYFVFQAPLGYRYKKTKGHGKLLVRDEPNASIVQEALEGYARGRFQTQAEVRKFLEKHETIPKNAHGRIANKRVPDLLTRVLYAGYITHERWGISMVRAHHEPLIDLETFERIQGRMKGRAYVPARKDLNQEFPLRGFILCGDCGKPYTSCFSKGKTKHHPYYLCQQKGCESYGKSLRRADVEGAFEELLQSLTPAKPVMKAATAMFSAIWDYRAKHQKQRRQELKAQREQTDEKINKALDLMIESSSAAVTKNLETKMHTLEHEKALLNEKIEGVSQPIRPFESISRTALRFLENPHKIWLSERFEDKRAVLKLVFTQGLAYERNHGARTPEISLPFKLLRDISTNNNQMVPRARIELALPKKPDFESGASTNSATPARGVIVPVRFTHIKD